MTPNIKMIKKYGIPKVKFYIKNIMNFIGPRKRSKQGPTKPLLTPTCAPKSATENHHFWEASIASPEKWIPHRQFFKLFADKLDNACAATFYNQSDYLISTLNQ